MSNNPDRIKDQLVNINNKIYLVRRSDDQTVITEASSTDERIFRANEQLLEPDNKATVSDKNKGTVVEYVSIKGGKTDSFCILPDAVRPTVHIIRPDTKDLDATGIRVLAPHTGMGHHYENGDEIWVECRNEDTDISWPENWTVYDFDNNKSNKSHEEVGKRSVYSVHTCWDAEAIKYKTYISLMAVEAIEGI